MNIKNKKLAAVAVLGSAILLTSTLAYFTDRQVFDWTRQTGYVDIAFGNTNAKDESYIFPGAAVDINYEVINKSKTNGVGVTARDTLVVYATDNISGDLVALEDSVALFTEVTTDDAGNTVGTTELTTKTTKEKGLIYVAPEYNFSADSETQSKAYKLVMSKDAANNFGGCTFHVGVLTEAKQSTPGAAWEDLSKTEIVVGETAKTDGDFTNVLNAILNYNVDAVAQETDFFLTANTVDGLSSDSFTIKLLNAEGESINGMDEGIVLTRAENGEYGYAGDIISNSEFKVETVEVLVNGESYATSGSFVDTITSDKLGNVLMDKCGALETGSILSGCTFNESAKTVVLEWKN